MPMQGQAHVAPAQVPGQVHLGWAGIGLRDS